MNYPELITAQHLALKAVIYIRQSTPHQVKNNQESRLLQHALKDRAIQLGWSPENIDIIDTDLGITGTNLEQRQGIQELIAKVARGEVGIVFSVEVTRLSRNCSDWFPLLDICSYKKTLIGDREGIYDPRTPNGRFILGIKGQFAEIELNTIHGRMTEGLLNKAKRGDLILQLPTGLIQTIQGYVEKDFNIEVQNCIETIFDLFLKYKSASKVLRFFKDKNLKIPRKVNKELVWKRPTVAAILSILKNPAYAGANVYGKTEQVIVDFSSKRKITKKLPMDKWKYVVKDKFPSYISWEIFEKIQDILKENYAEYDRNKTRGIARNGKALLHGITYCGACGHKLVVQYKHNTRYICNHLRQQYGTKVCQFIPADPVDEFVVKSFFKAISPIEINAYEKIVEQQWHQKSAAHKMKKQQVERLRYQAKLAERQYNQVDPDNRLVAAELERRWESSLQELRKTEEEFNQELNIDEVQIPNLPKELADAFLSVGSNLKNAWKSLSQKHKKSFLRCLIDKVVIHRKERNCIEARIVWVGGSSTTKELLIPVGSFSELPNAKELEAKILSLAKENKTDREIANHLTKQGYRSPMGDSVLPSTVQIIRLKHGIMKNRKQSHPRRVSGYLTVTQLSKIIKKPPHWIYDRIHKGVIKVSKNTEGMFLFPDQKKTVQMFMDLKHEKIQNITL